MFTDSEKRGARILALLIVLGTATDLARARHPAGRGLPADPVPVAPVAADSSTAPRALDLNTATAAELDALPGIGPVLAARIVDRRRQIGSFRSPDELGAVPGIGPRLLARLRPLVRTR